MKDLVCSSLGVKYTLSGAPENADEYNEISKDTAACFDRAMGAYVAHVSNGQFRDKFGDAAEEQLGVSRLRQQVKGKDGKPAVDADGQPVMEITESAYQYVKRVKEEHGVTDLQLQEIANSISVSFDDSKTVREASVKKIPSDYIQLANEAIKDAGSADVAAAKLSEVLGKPVEASVESIALAVREYVIEERKKTTANLKSRLGLAA